MFPIIRAITQSVALTTPHTSRKNRIMDNAHLSKPLDFNKLKNILARIKKNGSVSL